ncbi:hypothetical protein FRC04_009662 [Tulasnella sp. 424]|nr:hypothetical protein FRC04_009662 [Tulasnella sp. 424]
MQLIRLVYFVSGNDNNFCQLLQTQPHLEHLTIHGGIQNLETLDKKAIPKLRRLTARLTEAAAIAPSRPIEELHIRCYSGTPNIDDPLFHNLSLSTQTIRIFSLDLLWWNGEGSLRSIFKVVALNLPEIEQLTFWYGGVVAPQVILDGVSLFLSIRRLALLFFDLTVATEQSSPSTGLSDDYDASQKLSVADNWDDIFRILKQRCPLLVDFEHTPRM